MLMVRDIMLKNVVTAKENITIEASIRMLHRKHIGSVVITDNEDKCLGIFTARAPSLSDNLLPLSIILSFEAT